MQFPVPATGEALRETNHKVKFCTANKAVESNYKSSAEERAHFPEDSMGRKVGYWVSTLILAAMMAFAAFAYLSGSPQAVSGFAKLGYPQHFRIILGVAKLAGVIALLAPGLPLIKEWAYAGFTFAWLGAIVAHTSAGDPLSSRLSPVVLLVLLAVSYVTRAASRRLALYRPLADTAPAKR
jgi:hypothetical protein